MTDNIYDYYLDTPLKNQKRERLFRKVLREWPKYRSDFLDYKKGKTNEAKSIFFEDLIVFIWEIRLPRDKKIQIYMSDIEPHAFLSHLHDYEKNKMSMTALRLAISKANKTRESIPNKASLEKQIYEYQKKKGFIK